MSDDVEFSQATQRIDDELRTDLDRSLELDMGDLADIFCILHPTKSLQHEADKENVENPGTNGSSASSRHTSPTDIVLRLSKLPKDPSGYAFGRGLENDYPIHDPQRRISHIHFRIYINEWGTIMVEDCSRNGTVVEGKILRCKEKENDSIYRHTVDHGTEIRCATVRNDGSFRFIVRIPRREGEVEEMYDDNLNQYFVHLNALKNQITKKANPSPLVLFPHATSGPTVSVADSYASKRSRVWKGGEKYNIVKKIGQGAFAVVYKITHKHDGKAFAAKELDKRKFMKDGKLDKKVSSELKIMARIHHDNVVQFVEFFDLKDYLYIIMELIPGGDVGQMIAHAGVFGEDQVRDMTIQLLGALEYLHSRGITHRDIKPDNILLSNHDPIRVKLTDFGLSKMVEDKETFMQTFCGTLLYCAPEVYREFERYDEHGNYHYDRSFSTNPGDRYSDSCDLWSLAAVLFFSLCGEPPFNSDTGEYLDLLRCIMTGALDIRPLQKQNLSETCIKFLKAMLQKWPEHRPSIEKLKAHAWLTGEHSTQVSTDDADEVDLIPDQETVCVPTELVRSTSELAGSRVRDDEVDKFGSLEEVDRNNLRLSLERSFDIPSNLNSAGSSASESFAFMKNGPNRERLFGELASSALGSSGAIPDRQLNLSFSSFGNAQSQQQNNIRNHSTVESDAYSVFRTENGTLLRADSAAAFGSPSLLGAEAVFGQLQVRSPSAGTSPQSEMAASPEAQSPDDNALQASQPIPSFVTAPSPSLRRQRDEYEEEADEPVTKRPKIRPGDSFSIPLSYWWDPRDMSTWHDDYPTMTFAELRAKEEEAEAQGTKYKPPRTTSTPNYSSTGISNDCNSPTPSLIYENKSSSTRKISRNTKDDGFQVPRSIVAKFIGEKGTALPSIVINVTEQYTSWGRGTNTHVYPKINESRIGKWQLKLIMLNPGMDAEQTLKSPDSSFYLATKATSGLKVNGFHVPSHERNSFKGELRHWVQLKHDDLVSIWDGSPDEKGCVRLRFHCYFGASSIPRAANEPVAFLPEGIERAELEAIAARRDQELYEERQLSVKNANAMSGDSTSGASAVVARQPEARTTASTPRALDTGKARVDKRVARLRQESGASPNLPQTFDSSSLGSKEATVNKSLQGTSANQNRQSASFSGDGHAFAVQPLAINRITDGAQDKSDNLSSAAGRASPAANPKQQMNVKNRSVDSSNTVSMSRTSRQPVGPVRLRKSPDQSISANRDTESGQGENQSFPDSEATTEIA